ncbi:hypothetical protein QR685DRAFT_492668 [Neurospora intermedia]|uniref:Uncharacterized protein n=1 Tax=Neurospora intermedia TaxID=5142 RepID=A0ABR3DM70_NEUIN
MVVLAFCTESGSSPHLIAMDSDLELQRMTPFIPSSSQPGGEKAGHIIASMDSVCVSFRCDRTRSPGRRVHSVKVQSR